MTPRTLAAATALALAAPLGPAGAAGIPVIDSTSIAQLLTQLEQMQADYEAQLQQLQQLQQQYETMVQQLDQLQQHYAAVTGPRGIGGILNTVDDIRNRDAADTLGAILDGSITGDIDAMTGNVGRIAGRIEELRTTYDLGDIGAFAASDEAVDRAIAEVAGAGMAAVATAEDAYARSNEAMGRVNELIVRIDGNPDLKASTDYNSRMLAELAVLLNETLRLQAVAANADGAAALSRARDLAAQRAFMRRGE